MEADSKQPCLSSDLNKGDGDKHRIPTGYFTVTMDMSEADRHAANGDRQSTGDSIDSLVLLNQSGLSIVNEDALNLPTTGV